MLSTFLLTSLVAFLVGAFFGAYFENQLLHAEINNFGKARINGVTYIVKPVDGKVEAQQ